jgi:hypothetical protein
VRMHDDRKAHCVRLHRASADPTQRGAPELLVLLSVCRDLCTHASATIRNCVGRPISIIFNVCCSGGHVEERGAMPCWIRDRDHGACWLCNRGRSHHMRWSSNGLLQHRHEALVRIREEIVHHTQESDP